MDGLTKEQRIEKERERLAALFNDLDAHQLQTASGLIASAAFLAVTLEDLEQEINAGGCIEEYQNGNNQSGLKVAASVQAYTALNAKYQSTIQKLLRIVPPEPEKDEKSAAEIQAAEEAARMKEAQQKQAQKQREMESAFLRACTAGTASAETYNEFCRKWKEDHAE